MLNLQVFGEKGLITLHSQTKLKQKTAQNTPRRPIQGASLWIPAFAGMAGSVLREWQEPMTTW